MILTKGVSQTEKELANSTGINKGKLPEKEKLKLTLTE